MALTFGSGHKHLRSGTFTNSPPWVCNVLLLSTFVCVVVISLYNHFTKYNNYWVERNVPGPKPTFFFGNIKGLALRQVEVSSIYKDIYDQYPNEKFVGFFRMRTPTLLVKDLEIMKHILIKDFHVFMERDPLFSENGLGANLFHSCKDTWQMLRNRFTPIFTPGKLKNMIYLLTDSADRLVEYVEGIVQVQPEQEIHGIIKKYTIETIAGCAFGLNLNSGSVDSHREELNKLERKIFIFNHRAELEMMYPGILRKFNISLLHKDVKNFFFKLTKQIIHERNGEPTGRNDIMDLLLTLRKAKHISEPKNKRDHTEKTLEITDEILASQIFIFYTGGFQTSATVMSFMLCHLAYDRDIQDKVVEEIKAVLQMHDGKLTYEAVSDLKYMEQVLCETTRMHPVVYSIRRTAGADYKVPGTDLTVEKGQIFIIPVNLIHMDPTIYPNPEVFNPERFTVENMRARHSCVYLGFGIGPRSCLGYRFAKMQVKIGLVKLMSRFGVELSTNTPSAKEFLGEPARMVTFPIGGFPLRLVRRY